MRTLAIVVNERCNIGCSYCFNTTHNTVVRRRAESNGLSELKIREVATALSHLKYDSVTLTGGEPTVSKRCGMWLNELARNDVRTILITNLVHLPTSIEELIFQHKKITVRVSLGGGSPQVHNAEREKFRESEKNLKKLVQRGVNCEVTMVITPENLSAVPEFERFSNDLGCVGHIVPVSGFLGRILSDATTAEWEDVMARIEGPQLLQNLLMAQALLTKSASPSGCPLRTQSHVLSQDGNLVGCFFREDIQFGNVTKTNAIEVFKQAWSPDVLPADCFGDHCIGIHLH